MKSALMQDWVNKISQADVSTVQQVLIIFPIHDVLLPLIARVFTPHRHKHKAKGVKFPNLTRSHMGGA